MKIYACKKDKLICKYFSLFQIARAFPALLNLFKKDEGDTLTFRRLSCLLKPEFAEVGTNERKFQNEVYSIFIKYTREAGSK